MPSLRRSASKFMGHLEFGENRHARTQWNAPVLEHPLHVLKLACHEVTVTKPHPLAAQQLLRVRQLGLVGLELDAQDLPTVGKNKKIRQAAPHAACLHHAGSTLAQFACAMV